jgi:hypothetical protein
MVINRLPNDDAFWAELEQKLDLSHHLIKTDDAFAAAVAKLNRMRDRRNEVADDLRRNPGRGRTAIELEILDNGFGEVEAEVEQKLDEAFKRVETKSKRRKMEEP